MKDVAIIEGQIPTIMPEGPGVERKILGPGISVKRFGTLSPTHYSKVLNNVSAVISRPGAAFSREMILSMKKCQVIVSLGVGYDHICLNTAREMKIPVCNVRNYCTDEVADTTIAMLLAHQRKLFLYTQQKKWDWKIYIPIKRATQTQVGIIGYGNIGKAVTKRLKAFGYKIAIYDPFIQSNQIEPGFQKIDRLKELLSASDIISVHSPLTNETAGLIDESFFSYLKSQAIVINTARGGIFKNIDLLYQALKEHPELRIATDAWPVEPPPPHPLLEAMEQNELWLSDRLLIYPHTAFYSENALYDLRTFAAQIVKTVLEGGKPYNIINGIEA